MSCNSITKKGEQCTKPRLPFSKYCLFHQDLTAWVIGTLLGIFVTAGIALWQSREPNLRVKCQLDEAGCPSKLKCVVDNSGRAEALDITVSFNNLLPLDTKLICSPELGINLEEIDSLPNPQASPESAKLITAFIVKIPRVTAKNRIEFSVVTTNIDNVRAAKQDMKIRKHIEYVKADFYEKILAKYPHEINKDIIKSIFSGRIKDDNFFIPDKFSYEKGIFPVEFITEEEKVALVISQELYKKYKKEFISVFKDRPKFKAPVLRIKTKEGPTTLGIFPPYINTYSEFKVSFSDLEKEGIMSLPIPVPQSYD